VSDTALPARREAPRQLRQAVPASPPRRRTLGALPTTVAVLAIGAAVGLGGTWLAVERGAGFGAVRVGPWVSFPRNGSTEADPYSRAIVARSGGLPLGLGEGLSFTATRDSAARPLVGSCVYRIVGRVPQTRYWTLALETPAGALIPNQARRHGFTSAEVVRDASGVFAIAVSTEARPGNWLPVGSDGRFELVLRLYDTPLSGTSTVIDPGRMPQILREDCR
jgi:hypothetical protein